MYTEYDLSERLDNWNVTEKPDQIALAKAAEKFQKHEI